MEITCKNKNNGKKKRKSSQSTPAAKILGLMSSNQKLENSALTHPLQVVYRSSHGVMSSAIQETINNNGGPTLLILAKVNEWINEMNMAKFIGGTRSSILQLLSTSGRRHHPVLYRHHRCLGRAKSFGEGVPELRWLVQVEARREERG